MLLNLIIGTAVGLASTGLLLLLHAMELLRTDRGGQILFLALAFHITGLIWALGRHRALAGGEGVPFSRLFGAGLMVSFIAGLVVAAGTLFFTEVVDPTYLEWVEQQSLKQLETMELSEEDRRAHEQQLAQMTPMAYAVQGLMGTLVAGFFLSLTLAAFLRMRVLKSPG